MSDTNKDYKLNLIKKAIMRELKNLDGKTTIKSLIEKTDIQEELIEKALEELENNGYIIRTSSHIEQSWASRKLNDNWKPKGEKTTITIKALNQKTTIKALAIKGIERPRRAEEKPSTIILKILNKAKNIVQKAETPKALNYAQHLTIQAINKATKHNIITKTQATKLKQTIKPNRKLLLTIITNIEKQLK